MDGTVLITGAASGIGRCFAQRLASSATRLILCDVDDGGLAITAAALPQSAARVERVRLDVAQRNVVEAQFAALFAIDSRLDLVIHCAAILGPGTWSEQSAPDFEHVIGVDFLGSVNVVRAALPFLRPARGRVVLLASTAAIHGWPGIAAYSAAKFAVAGWAEGVRPELAADGVGITVVFPLLIDTPLIDRPETPPILRRGRRIAPDVVVQRVMSAVAKGRPRVYIPASVRLIAAIQGLAPSVLDWWGRRFGLRQ